MSELLNVIGTDLYKRTMQWAEHDGRYRYGDLMREVWSVTPWMVDAYTGGYSNNLEREENIREWCREHFGQEASPLHGIKGAWQRGSATINGYTWMGFATQEMLEKFCQRWADV